MDSLIDPAIARALLSELQEQLRTSRPTSPYDPVAAFHSPDRVWNDGYNTALAEANTRINDLKDQLDPPEDD